MEYWNWRPRAPHHTRFVPMAIDGRPPWTAYQAYPLVKPPRRDSATYRRRSGKRTTNEPTFVDYCDVCDRGFKNLKKRAEHFGQHVKCSEPGCDFEAHFKVVAVHKQNFHGPNRLKISLETAEDIQKWRKERKRKYPTLSNIESKAKEFSKQREQGNILKDKFFGKMHRVTETSHSATNLGKPCAGNTKNPHVTASSFKENSATSSDEDECLNTTNTRTNLSVSLGTLMQNYASDTDNEEMWDSLTTKNLTRPVLTADPRDSLLTEEETSALMHPEGHHKDRHNCRVLEKPNNRRTAKVKRTSLLSMLLARDIRHERNQILQCVCFIVKNKFFGDGFKGIGRHTTSSTI